MTKLRPVLVVLAALALLALPTGARSQPAAPPAAVQKGGPIPVDASDLSWGSRVAPVTLVHFTDLQCPFCSRVMPTLEQLEKHYGPQQLRVVLKHMPLPFHKEARPAAETAVAVLQLRGNQAGWRYLDAAFEAFRNQGDHIDALRKMRIDPDQVERLIRGGKPGRKVDADVALAGQIDVRGTPSSFVNGVKLSGAQPFEKFKDAIDDQLAAARTLRSRGVQPDRVYVELTQQNFQAPAPPGPPAPPSAPSLPADSNTVWRVPIAGSPSLGPESAAVTIVMFADYQCPYSKKAAETMAEVRKKYGQQVRIVFKHNPLAFHQRAEPAAQLTLYAFAAQGHRGFWKAHDKVFENPRQLEDADLERIAGQLRLDRKRAMQAVHHRDHAKHIEADQQLAKALNALGTPAFFVNGRRLSGAQPLAQFELIIDEEIAHAQQLRAQGVPARRIYHTIQQGAQAAP